MKARAVYLYTDGSSLGNPGPGGYGIILEWVGMSYVKEFSAGFTRTTNNRMELLGGTCEQYIELFAAQKGEVKAIVITAIALTAELKQQVLQEAKKLSDKKAILENKIDPSIIGGYILKIGDMQYDASVSNQLNTIKTTLTKTNSI